MDRDLPAIDPDPAGLHRIRAEDGAGDLGAAGPDQAGKAQDLALAQLEADAVEHHRVRVTRVPPAGDALDLQGDGAGAVLRPASEQPVDLAADHHPDDPLDVELADRGLAHQRAVAQHRGPVADPHHLLEPVGDEHHRDSSGLQLADDRDRAAAPPCRTAPRSARP